MIPEIVIWSGFVIAVCIVGCIGFAADICERRERREDRERVQEALRYYWAAKKPVPERDEIHEMIGYDSRLLRLLSFARSD